MTSMRLWTSLIELGLLIVLSGVVIAILYRVFLKSTSRYDVEKEIREGNVAVGIVMGSIMISAGLLTQKGVGASFVAFRLSFVAPDAAAEPLWFTLILLLGHIVVSMAVSIATVAITLRLFGRLVNKFNPAMDMGDLLRQGNMAVAAILAAVVFLTAAYVGKGVSSVTKALVPQPHIGRIQVME